MKIVNNGSGAIMVYDIGDIWFNGLTWNWFNRTSRAWGKCDTWLDAKCELIGSSKRK